MTRLFSHPRSDEPGSALRSVRRWVLFAIPVLAAVMAACSSPAKKPEATPPSRQTTVSTAGTTTTLGTDGAHIFEVKCAECHSSSGHGDLGPSLVGVADRMTEEEQISVVSSGRNFMPRFSPGLSDEQIRAVVEYTRTQLH